MISKNPIEIKLYRTWQRIKKRCYNPKTAGYRYWGGRGITVSPDWMIYENFKRDMLPSCKMGLSIDRIDNDGNYSKENCRWATKLEQQNNQSRCVMVTYKGLTKSVKDWSRYMGVKYGLLQYRLCEAKWPIEKAFTQPSNRPAKKGNQTL